jgi:uncharacterized membrane protein YozB (DUF420 family)
VRRFLLDLPLRLFLVVMLGGSVLITASSLAYFEFDALPPFVIEKFPLRFEALWLASLRIHVASALVAFPLCLVLMTRTLQKRPLVHRWFGRVAGILILFALVPTGVVLALDAKGGSVGTLGFLLSGALVGWFMVRGVLAARRRELVSHRRAMLHVVMQMSVAVTSRALMIGLDLAGIDPDLSYLVALWAPVLASAAVAEAISRPALFASSTLFRPIERIYREISPLALLVRARSVVRPVARLSR